MRRPTIATCWKICEVINPVRFKTKLAANRTTSTEKYRSLQSYLDHTKGKLLSTVSPYFIGTLYELTTLKFLEEYLGVKRLIHSGGTADNGIDLRGSWSLKKFLPKKLPQYGLLKVEPTGNRLKPIVSKTQYGVQLLVQCKLYQNKIGSAKIRELSGSFKYNVRQNEKNKSILMIVTPTTLTTNALLQFDSSDFPMMLVNLSLMKLSSQSLDAYQIDNYSGGKLAGFYMNPYCRVLLKDLSVEKEMKKLMITTK